MLDGTTEKFQAVSEAAKYDAGPGNYRIGLILLSNDYVTERDFMNMRPSDDVAIFASRLPNAPDCTVETLSALAPHITEATSLIVPEGRLDAIAYSCTSGTAVLGFDEVESRIHSARPGIPCTTPMTASVEALNKFGADNIAVLTPYVDDVNETISSFLESAGKTIVGFSRFSIAEAEKMAELTTESIYNAALEADREDADALFISCTAIRAVEIVEKLEKELGKPVVAAVQAMFWQSLRLSGYDGMVKGYGRLLRNEFD